MPQLVIVEWLVRNSGAMIVVSKLCCPYLQSRDLIHASTERQCPKNGWLPGCLVDFLDCVAGWLAGCLAGWLPGWLAGWLANWLVG